MDKSKLSSEEVIMSQFVSFIWLLQMIADLTERIGMRLSEYSAPEVYRLAYYEFLRVAYSKEEVLLSQNLLLEWGEPFENVRNFIMWRVSREYWPCDYI
jgi:hypothetical protein